MKRFSAIFYYDLKCMFSFGFVLCALAPLFAGALVALSLPPSYLRSGTIEPFDIAVACNDKTFVGDTLVSAISELSLIKTLYLCDETEAEAYLKDGRAAVAVVIPDGLMDALITARPLTITISATSFLEGGVMLGLGQNAAQTMNIVQSAVYSYYDAAIGSGISPEVFEKNAQRLANRLLLEMLTRGKAVVVAPSADPLLVQVLTVALFVLASFSSVWTTFHFAGQLRSGALARMRLAGLDRFTFYLAKQSEAVLLTLVMAVPAAGLLSVFNMRDMLAGLLLCACLVNLLSLPLYLLIALPCRDAQGAMLACCAAMLVMLFTGGGFYPPYLLGGFSAPYNPAFIARECVLWAMGGAFPANMRISALPAVFAWAALFFGWEARRC